MYDIVSCQLKMLLKLVRALLPGPLLFIDP